MDFNWFLIYYYYYNAWGWIMEFLLILILIIFLLFFDNYTPQDDSDEYSLCEHSACFRVQPWKFFLQCSALEVVSGHLLTSKLGSWETLRLGFLLFYTFIFCFLEFKGGESLFRRKYHWYCLTSKWSLMSNWVYWCQNEAWCLTESSSIQIRLGSWFYV